MGILLKRDKFLLFAEESTVDQKLNIKFHNKKNLNKTIKCICKMCFNKYLHEVYTFKYMTLQNHVKLLYM